MKIAVLVKQVPDMDAVRFDREKGVVDRKSAGTEVNPFDLNALEEAVKISETSGAEVTAVSMGPPNAEKALRECMARGAAKGVLVSDAKFGGSDTRATSAILAAALRKLGGFDLIFCGEKTVDGDTGQVGPEVAENLKIPYASFVSKVDAVGKKAVRIDSELWDGTYQKEILLPALLTVTKDINEPRLPSFRNKMQARKAEITTLTFQDLSPALKETAVGFQGSPTKVKKIEVPPEWKRRGVIYRDETIPQASDRLIGILRQKKILG